MKIGQPKLPERETQRSGLLATPTNVGQSEILIGEVFGLKASNYDLDHYWLQAIR
jgi:hypothetical protein